MANKLLWKRVREGVQRAEITIVVGSERAGGGPSRRACYVGYVDRGCAGAGEALRVHSQGKLRRWWLIWCPAPLAGLAGH